MVESNWKALNVSHTQRNRDRSPIDCYPRMNHSVPLSSGHSSSLLELPTQTDNWILLDGNKVSVSWLKNNLVSWFPVPQMKIKVINSLFCLQFMRLSNLSSNSKKDLCRRLEGADGQDVFVLGVSYSDAQSLSTCRDYPKANSYTLPRCRSYRLRKTQLMADPFDTLSSITSRANNECRTIYFSRVLTS